jgi:hypothetical protein
VIINDFETFRDFWRASGWERVEFGENFRIEPSIPFLAQGGTGGSTTGSSKISVTARPLNEDVSSQPIYG